jgi:hypothetical protein
VVWVLPGVDKLGVPGGRKTVMWAKVGLMFMSYGVRLLLMCFFSPF